MTWTILRGYCTLTKQVYRLFTLREVWMYINRITGATVMESLTDEICKNLREARTGDKRCINFIPSARSTEVVYL